MTTTNCPTISTKELHWDKETQTFTAEVSGLETSDGLLFGMFSHFAVVSHITGKLVTFEQVSKNFDREMDIVSWVFEARANPSMKMVLFND